MEKNGIRSFIFFLGVLCLLFVPTRADAADRAVMTVYEDVTEVLGGADALQEDKKAEVLSISAEEALDAACRGQFGTSVAVSLRCSVALDDSLVLLPGVSLYLSGQDQPAIAGKDRAALYCEGCLFAEGITFEVPGSSLEDAFLGRAALVAASPEGEKQGYAEAKNCIFRGGTYGLVCPKGAAASLTGCRVEGRDGKAPLVGVLNRGTLVMTDCADGASETGIQTGGRTFVGDKLVLKNRAACLDVTGSRAGAVLSASVLGGEDTGLLVRDGGKCALKSGSCGGKKAGARVRDGNLLHEGGSILGTGTDADIEEGSAVCQGGIYALSTGAKVRGQIFLSPGKKLLLTGLPAEDTVYSITSGNEDRQLGRKVAEVSETVFGASQNREGLSAALADHFRPAFKQIENPVDGALYDAALRPGNSRNDRYRTGGPADMVYSARVFATFETTAEGEEIPGLSARPELAAAAGGYWSEEVYLPFSQGVRVQKDGLDFSPSIRAGGWQCDGGKTEVTSREEVLTENRVYRPVYSYSAAFTFEKGESDGGGTKTFSGIVSPFSCPGNTPSENNVYTRTRRVAVPLSDGSGREEADVSARLIGWGEAPGLSHKDRIYYTDQTIFPEEVVKKALAAPEAGKNLDILPGGAAYVHIHLYPVFDEPPRLAEGDLSVTDRELAEGFDLRSEILSRAEARDREDGRKENLRLSIYAFDEEGLRSAGERAETTAVLKAEDAVGNVSFYTMKVMRTRGEFLHSRSEGNRGSRRADYVRFIDAENAAKKSSAAGGFLEKSVWRKKGDYAGSLFSAFERLSGEDYISEFTLQGE